MISTFVKEPLDKPGECKAVKALLMPCREWNRVTMYLKKKEMEREEAQRKFKEKQRIKDTSAALQMEWHDSILTVQTRRIATALKKQAEREASDKRRDRDNAAFFEAEKLQKLAISHKQRKYQTVNFRNMSKALQYVSVLKEQELQREVNKKVKSWEDKREAKHVEHVLEDIAAFNKEEQEKAERRLEIKLKYKEDLMAQLNMRKANAEKQKREQEETERREAELTKKAVQLYEEAVKKKEQDDIDRLISQVNEYREISGDLKQQAEFEEEQKDKVLDLYRRTDKMIADKIKQRIAELRKAEEERKERLRRKILAEMQMKSDQEDEQIRNAQKQEEARLEKIRRQRADFDARILKERKDFWQAHLQDMAEQREEDEIRHKLQYAQRCKQEELNVQYLGEVRERDQAVRAQYKQDWLKQMEEHKQTNEKEEAKDKAGRDEQWNLLQSDDEEYIKFAESVIEEAKQREWDTYPLFRAHELELLKMGRYLKKDKNKCKKT